MISTSNFFLVVYKNLGLFLVNDMQTPPSFKFGQIGFLVQKDAHCSEAYEKKIIFYLMRIGRFCTQIF